MCVIGGSFDPNLVRFVTSASRRIIANIHKLCRALGLITTYAQRGTSTKDYAMR